MENPSEIIWRPDPETAKRTRIARFMATHGFSSIDALHRRAVEAPEWYWDAVCRDLGIQWMTPYKRVLDTSQGIAWPRWFEGGEINIASNCVDRYLDPAHREKPALIWEGDGGETRSLTYRELAR